MENTKKTGFRAFLSSKGVTLSPKLYFVDAMSAMALGLFASLLIGTIFGTLARIEFLPDFLKEILTLLDSTGKAVTGAAIGVAVAYSLKAPLLVMLSAGFVGMLGNAYGLGYLAEFASRPGLTAGPAGAFVAALIAVEVGKLVSKATKVDILVTPAVTIATGTAVTVLISPLVAYCADRLGTFINYATTIMPFFMGIIISVVVGIILTLPISSAAICAMFGITGLAGGAAFAGCCAQMIGFAVISFRENKWGGLVAQGIGTSMIQMGNIIKNPLIWIPATLASAITGPIATCIFKLQCTGVYAGMGTCGAVGPIGVFTDMGFTANSTLGVILVGVVLPAVFSLIISELMRKIGWIKPDDMKLDL